MVRVSIFHPSGKVIKRGRVNSVEDAQSFITGHFSHKKYVPVVRGCCGGRSYVYNCNGTLFRGCISLG